MSEDDSHLVLGFSTSGAEALAAKLPAANVVSAFSTAPSEVLLAVFGRRGKAAAPDLIYCGDNKVAKRRAAALIRDAGFNPVDMGPLSSARCVEPYSLLLAQLAYEGKGGPELTYRFLHVSK